jgi:general secretion pathway protein F
MKFRYQAMTVAGQKIQGTLDATDERQARQQLRENGLYLLKMKAQRGRFLQKRQVKISSAELTLFTRQLATLCSAALPLEESLSVIARQSASKKLHGILEQVRNAILEGHTLSDALGHFPAIFDSLYRTLIKAGEKSGMLAPVMEKLADYNESRQQTRAKLAQSLIYPVMLTSVAIVVVIILLTTVVPRVAEQFIHMKQQLPLTTRTLLAISSALQHAGPMFLVVLVLAICGFLYWLKRGDHRHRFHAALLRFAFPGRLLCALNCARYLRTLSILQASGVPLLEGMKLSTESISNLAARQRLDVAAENVRQGNSIHLSLEKTALFPPMMLYMIASGEKSGQLSMLMTRAADNQEALLQNRIAIALAIFEPALIIVMAMIVLFIVVSVLQPILQLNSMIS